MEMHQVRYYLAVAETLNFTKAAERCNVTQPALSRAIQLLEAEVGGVLINRERGLTHLTDLGRLMKPYLEQMLAQSAAAKQTAKEFLTLEKAPLKLGVMCTIGPLQFTGFLSKFHRENPGIQIEVTEGRPANLAQMLEAGALDVAFMGQPTEFGERLDAKALYRERFCVAAPPGHRFSAMETVTLRDLDGEDYIRRLNCEFGPTIRSLATEAGAKYNVIYASEREDWVQTMVLAGLGVSSMPEFTPAMPGLVTRRYVRPEVARDVCLVTVAGRRHSPALATFVGEVKRYEWARKSDGRAA
jgi:DNA-binding transcriptional LysR family regulator